MSADRPKKMRALVLEEYRQNIIDALNGLKVGELPVPKPEKGQVLVRIRAAPCNPSDLLLLQGKYGTLKKLPTVPGWEGAGEVVASGGGWLANWLNGKRVACALRGDRNGTWAEYFVAKAAECIPLKRQITFEQAASLIINPFTAFGLLETARKGGHHAAVHTAGASQLGRMLQTTAVEEEYPLINVVRRKEQLELLRSLGAKYVLNSSNDSFADELKTLCERLGATVAFEAIAGNMTGTVMNSMPHDSIVYVYGALSEEPCGNIDPVQLIFHSKEVKGFYLGEWMRQRGTLGILRIAGRIQRMVIDRRIESVVQRRVGLNEAKEGLRHYVDNMTEGKVLITPHADPSAAP
ncbi:MAG TPA: zinc-binding dehydrogenase [Lacipirellulaceae bacterium]|nr:zinc-binding dehydrogenase [Lacipirellulaceae bacterium]